MSYATGVTQCPHSEAVGTHGTMMQQGGQVTFAVCCVLIVALCGTETFARTWTNSTGKFKIEGEFVKLADGTVDIRRDDGKLIRIPLDKLSEEDQKYVREATARTAEATPFVVADDGEGAKDTRAMSQRDDAIYDRTALAEGVGLTREEALKDAFRAAVRQVVGAFVDANAIAQNDELIEDKVITYSDGTIKSHRKLSERQVDGLFRVRIQATVECGKVLERLRVAKVSIKNLNFRGIVHDAEAEMRAIAEQKQAAAAKDALQKENRLAAVDALKSVLADVSRGLVEADVVGA